MAQNLATHLSEAFGRVPVTTPRNTFLQWHHHIEYFIIPHTYDILGWETDQK